MAENEKKTAEAVAEEKKTDKKNDKKPEKLDDQGLTAKGKENEAIEAALEAEDDEDDGDHRDEHERERPGPAEEEPQQPVDRPAIARVAAVVEAPSSAQTQKSRQPSSVQKVRQKPFWQSRRQPQKLCVC